MEIEYLPVYVPTAEDRDSPTVYAQHVQVRCSRSVHLSEADGVVQGDGIVTPLKDGSFCVNCALTDTKPLGLSVENSTLHP